MPELPEVETTRRGIEPHIRGKRVSRIVIRQPRLRWPVSEDLEQNLTSQIIVNVSRRAKYILLETSSGTVILHLGMSGSLRIVSAGQPAGKHDHVDVLFSDNTLLRFTDPRRFGAFLWTSDRIEEFPLLKNLGPEPLSNEFDGDQLYELSRKRTAAVKSFIMDSQIVVGVGNIYASESLFLAGIKPTRQAGRISLSRYQKLSEAIRQVLRQAIQQGGTTLRDFVNESGKPGYFKQSLAVYGRSGEPCILCQTPIRQVKIGQRASYYCPSCQT